jgi:hypothetical protein
MIGRRLASMEKPCKSWLRQDSQTLSLILPLPLRPSFSFIQAASVQNERAPSGWSANRKLPWRLVSSPRHDGPNLMSSPTALMRPGQSRSHPLRGLEVRHQFANACTLRAQQFPSFRCLPHGTFSGLCFSRPSACAIPAFTRSQSMLALAVIAIHGGDSKLCMDTYGVG